MTTTIHKGFLFQSEDGTWILSQSPNLKHCCLGKIDPNQKQILVEGEFDPSCIGKVVCLKGELQPWAQGYILKEATLSAGNQGIPFASIGMAFAGIALFLLYLKKKKQ